MLGDRWRPADEHNAVVRHIAEQPHPLLFLDWRAIAAALAARLEDATSEVDHRRQP